VKKSILNRTSNTKCKKESVVDIYKLQERKTGSFDDFKHDL